ncbi:helix-turn-helix transcriptional regulator [Natronorubrum daqingense]|uniref:IclR helix-turn-helix domain-containing protein n=1 Tax=Natronorubrum daqingense TaxID=588898 RepID=A0A1N7FIZ3_9EURY|nr:helix-turn-helix domain-containing protein [Natronorubrum daqingense]APX98312.1 hypothetical protein BB347_16485 [Natronorubrum daqingense]SIS00254.1 IclR helix-turn-helix domain-containing protein [Natronorubrum daqingense]
MTSQFHGSATTLVSPETAGIESVTTDISIWSAPFVAAGVGHPVQLEWSPHIAALLGILGLALLGGVLVVRNRLGSRDSFSADSSTHTEEFLTDREQVQQLIQDNGGRMKQSRIVDSVDWSKAKVSRLLAELEEEGRITKLRLGRENLVCLPGHEPTASQSPERPTNE